MKYFLVLLLSSLSALAQPVGGGTVGVPISSTGLTSNDVYNIAISAASTIGGATNGILKLNGFGTNTTLIGMTNLVIVDSGNAMAVTIGTNLNGTSGVIDLLIKNSVDANINIRDTNHGMFQIGVHPDHNLSMPDPFKMEGYVIGGSFAMAAHVIQHGAAYTSPMTEYYVDQQIDSNTNIWDSIQLLFRARTFTNTTTAIISGPGDTSGDYYAGLRFGPAGTNGDGVFGFYRKLNTSFAGTLNKTGEILQHGLYVGGNNPGISITGGITNDSFAGISTNVFVGNNVLTFHNGLLVQYAQLDSDLTTLLTSVGGTTTQMTNNLITFFATLKASGTYQKLQGLNGFCFANAGSNGQPWISGQAKLAWNGTFLTNDATGITADGTNGYADTRFQTSTNQNAGTLYVYCKTDGGSSAFVCGATGASKNSVIRHSSSTAWTGQINDPNGTAVSVAAVSFPCGVMITRTTSANEIIYAAGNNVTGPANTSTTPPDWTVYLCADNNAGSSGGSSPTGYWSGQVQGFAYSTNTLTQTDKSTLDAAFLALRTSMGN